MPLHPRGVLLPSGEPPRQRLPSSFYSMKVWYAQRKSPLEGGY